MLEATVTTMFDWHQILYMLVFVVLFVIIESRLMYRITNVALRTYDERSGSPTLVGRILHAIVFGLIVLVLWKSWWQSRASSMCGNNASARSNANANSNNVGARSNA